MVRIMKGRMRQFQANLYYLRRPFLEFLPLFILLLLLLAAGSVFFHILYRHPDYPQGLSYGQALYFTYCMIFNEHLIPFPEHWGLRCFFVVLPLIGLVTIVDGIVRFSYHILSRDKTGKEWVRAMAKTLRNHVILCGLGKGGLRILQQLIRLGEQVIVLEKNPNCPNLAFAHKNAIPVLIGNGREEGVFEEMNTAEAKSIILSTSDDLANLEMALDARKVQPKIRVVMRMYDQELAAKVREALGIHLGFSTSELAAPLFATSSSDRSIISAFYAGDQLLVVANLVIRPDSELLGKQIRDIGRVHRIFFLVHTRADQATFYPSAETDFQADDRLTIQTTPQTLKLVHQWNRDPEPY